MNIRPDGKIYDVALTVGYNNLTERKPVEYRVCITLIKEKGGEIFKYHNRAGELKVAELPHTENILHAKITKTQAKRMMADGVKVVAGYTVSKV